MKKFLNMFFVVMFGLFGCQNKSTNPEEEFPPGYQKEISWPSLADSPWPMEHHDPQSTGRSNFGGPVAGKVNWFYDSSYIECGISIGVDSSIYFTNNFNSLLRLFSISQNGKLKWTYNMPPSKASYTTPLILADGSIVTTTCLDSRLISLDYLGNVKWSYDIGVPILERGINIDLTGIIYIVDGSRILHAIDKNGKLLWKLQIENIGSIPRTSNLITISPDSKTLYVPGYTHALYAVDLTERKVKWTFGDQYFAECPMIDSDGNIYVIGSPESSNKTGRRYITSLNPDGSIRWKQYFSKINDGELIFHYAGTIDWKGNIYFTSSDSVYSIDYLGKRRWAEKINGFCWGVLISDKNNNIYIPITKDGINSQLQCYNCDGNLIWETETLDGYPGESYALGNKELYFPTYRSNKIYSIK